MEREERMERIFTELARCSKHGLRLAVLLDDAHLLLDASGQIPACWQEFFDLWIGRAHSGPALPGHARMAATGRGKDRKFLKEIELQPLSPEGRSSCSGNDFGFDDVARISSGRSIPQVWGLSALDRDAGK